MIIEIALGIVLAVLILIFMPAIISIGVIFIIFSIVAIGLYFIFFNFTKAITLFAISFVAMVGVFVSSTIFGILLSKIPIVNKFLFRNAYPLKKDIETTYIDFFIKISRCYLDKGLVTFCGICILFLIISVICDFLK